MQNMIMLFSEYILAFMFVARPLIVLIFGVLGTCFLHYIVFKKFKACYPDALSVHVFVRISTYLLCFLTVTAVLQSCGINLTIFIGAAGMIGVAIGFAAQASVANVVSGLFLAIERPFNLNDLVQINGIEGVVQALNLFAILVRTSDNRLIRIPNETALKSCITTINKHNKRRFELLIDFTPEVDLKHVSDLIHCVVKGSDYVLHQDPRIAVTHIAHDHVRMMVDVWAAQKHWHQANVHFLSDLKRSFEAQGIGVVCLSTRSVSI